MNIIFHKHKESGDYFKFTPEPNISQLDWDNVLDVISPKSNEIITEDEFNKQYSKLMDIDVMDKTSTYKIGILTTQWIDMEFTDKDERILYKL